MPRSALIWSAIAAAGLLWVAGLRLFLAAEMGARRKLMWSGFLVTVGVAIGFALSLPDLGTKFLWVLAILPILAALDVLVLRGTRGITYWFRACSFEVVTVFGTAALARTILDLLGFGALLGHALE